MTTGEVLAVFASERRRVHAEGHAQHRLVDHQAGQCHWRLDRGDGVADLDLGESGNHEQVARREFLHFVAAHAFERHQLAEATLERRLTLGELFFEQRNGVAAAHDAVDNATNGQTTEVLAGIERGDHGLQWRRGVALRGGNGLEDGVEQGRQVFVGARHANAAH